MLYHSSKIRNLKILEPHISTHNKPYVYALKSAVSSLIFGAQVDDFDLKISTNKNGVMEIFECYEGALEENYLGKSCSIYSVKETGFKNDTSWKTEFTSEESIKVVHEEYVENILQRLLLEESTGNIIINRYSTTPEYRAFISMHITNRLLRFKILENVVIETRLLKRYGKLIEGLKGVISGDLLD